MFAAGRHMHSERTVPCGMVGIAGQSTDTTGVHVQRIMKQRTTRVRTSDEGREQKRSKAKQRLRPPVGRSARSPGARQGTTRVKSGKRAEVGVGLVEAKHRKQAFAGLMTELSTIPTPALVLFGLRAMQQL